MLAHIVMIAGGVGLFLAGMIILTEGLKALTAGWLRRVLSHYTKSPFSGAVAGAVTTAIIQSSSATTVTAVGFVGAGLLSFPQALGVIFGANLGTTFTGWLVAILGFKLKLGVVAMAILPIGVLLRLFGRPPFAHVGWALAGFGLLFIGLDTMQEGAAVFKGELFPTFFPDNTFLGRLQLVAIGMLFTGITQSSSAGVAMAMVALASGAVTFPQAAALVIGMDVGTTFTAGLATLGGSAPMRQTGYAHIIYNVLTGVMAFFLLVPYLHVLQTLDIKGLAGNHQLALAVFHTAFNLLGVIVILPFTKPFAQFIMRLVPDTGTQLTSLLDKRFLHDADAATDAVVGTLKETTAVQYRTLMQLLRRGGTQRLLEENIKATEQAIVETKNYMERMQLQPNSIVHERHAYILHAIDHMRRLNNRCTQGERLNTLLRDKRLLRLSGIIYGCLKVFVSGASDENEHEMRLQKLQNIMNRQHERYRAREVIEASSGVDESVYLLDRLDSMRWLWRVSLHLWRAQLYLNKASS